MSKKRDGLTLRGETWWISYTHPVTGERVRCSAETTIKAKAKERLDREKGQAWDKKYTGECPPMTVSELFDWAKITIWQAMDSKTTEHVIKRARDYFGNSIANNVSVEDILKFRAATLASGVSIASFNRPASYLSAAYKAAINMEKLLKNPVSTARGLNSSLFTENKKGREIFLEADEESKLLSYCHGTLGMIVGFALRTGMRQGEILRLEWANLDFKNMRTNTWSKKGRGKKVKWRTVPILPDIIDILAKLPRHGQFVFSNEDGTQLSRNGIVHSSYKRITLALAKTNPKFLKVTFHTLRHTFASHYLMNGGKLDALAKILGHSLTETTEIYGHLSQEHLATQMSVMPRLNWAEIDNLRYKLDTTLNVSKEIHSKIVDNQ